MTDPSEDRPYGHPDAEALIVAVALSSPEHCEIMLDRLNAEEFVDENLAWIFRAIAAVAATGQVANPITIKPNLADQALYRLAVQLVSKGNGPALIGFKDFVAQVKDASTRRKFDAAISAAGRSLFTVDDQDPSMPGLASIDQIVADLDAAMGDAVGGNENAKDVTAGDCAAAAILDLYATESGIICGVIPALDNLIGHIRPTNFIVLGGRPGMGKSAVALTYARGAAQRGHGTLFISLEMSKLECGQRLLADEAFTNIGGVPFSTMTKRNATESEHIQLGIAQSRLAKLPLQIIDVSSITIGQLNSLVRRWKRRFEARGQSLDLVIIDYLQKVKPNNRANTKHDEITEVSDGLKAIAKQYQVGVLALAQLSRSLESRVDKRPTLPDLRESGSIEQDADVVLFVYRPEYYLRQAEPDPKSPEHAKWATALRAAEGRIEFIAAKQRHGVVGSANGQFHGAYQAVRG